MYLYFDYYEIIYRVIALKLVLSFLFRIYKEICFSDVWKRSKLLNRNHISNQIAPTLDCLVSAPKPNIKLLHKMQLPFKKW